MVNIVRQRLSKKLNKRILDNFLREIKKIKNPRMLDGFLSQFLTPAEQIMIKKRLAIYLSLASRRKKEKTHQ